MEKILKEKLFTDLLSSLKNMINMKNQVILAIVIEMLKENNKEEF